MKKKLLTIVAVILAAAALVVGSVAGTVAYLTASSAVSNVFTIGNVSLTMFEHKWTNATGSTSASLDTTVEVDTNSYHLMPNTEYRKDPTIRVTSTDMTYLFVKTSNQIRSIEEGNLISDATAAETMREQMEANGWVEFIRSGDGIEIVWVYGTRNVSTGVITPIAVNNGSVNTQTGKGGNTKAGEFVLFEKFKIGDIDSSTLALYGAAKVSITAFGIQNVGFTNTNNSNHAVIKEAWDAIKATYPYEGGISAPKNPYKTDATGDAVYEPVVGVDKVLPIELED